MEQARPAQARDVEDRGDATGDEEVEKGPERGGCGTSGESARAQDSHGDALKNDLRLRAVVHPSECHRIGDVQNGDCNATPQDRCERVRARRL